MLESDLLGEKLIFERLLVEKSDFDKMIMDLNVDFEKFTYFLEYLKKEYLDKLCELESLKVRNIENENILKMKVDEYENILSEK